MADTVHGGFLKSVPWNKWGEKTRLGCLRICLGEKLPYELQFKILEYLGDYYRRCPGGYQEFRL